MKPAPCRCELRTFPHRRDHHCERFAETEAQERAAQARDDRLTLAFDNADRAADCNATLRGGY